MKVLCLILLLAVSSTPLPLEDEEDQVVHNDLVLPAQSEVNRNEVDVLKSLPLDPKQLSFNVNKYIDELLVRYSHKIPRVKKIPDIHSKYAYDCYIEITPGIKRHGDAVFTVVGETVNFGFGLATNRIGVRCRWYKRIGFWKLRGTIKAHTDRVAVTAKFSMNLGASSIRPTLDDFKVVDLQPIKTDVTGLWIANKLAERYLNRKANGARDRIIAELEGSAKKTLQEELQKLKVPPELLSIRKKSIERS